ncbi:MAG: hypothetical protein GY714_02290 [Desulfobacterales bacterium]|nr:hypothetical protein [Desulfobacterales bacterium]
MFNIIRVNSLSGRSYIIPIDKILYIEETQDGESSYIHLVENKTIQCTERFYDIEENLKRIIR